MGGGDVERGGDTERGRDSMCVWGGGVGGEDGE